MLHWDMGQFEDVDGGPDDKVGWKDKRKDKSFMRDCTFERIFGELIVSLVRFHHTVLVLFGYVTTRLPELPVCQCYMYSKTRQHLSGLLMADV